jgi:hypothetical protein
MVFKNVYFCGWQFGWFCLTCLVGWFVCFVVYVLYIKDPPFCFVVEEVFCWLYMVALLGWFKLICLILLGWQGLADLVRVIWFGWFV